MYFGSRIDQRSDKHKMCVYGTLTNARDVSLVIATSDAFSWWMRNTPLVRFMSVAGISGIYLHSGMEFFVVRRAGSGFDYGKIQLVLGE